MQIKIQSNENISYGYTSYFNENLVSIIESKKYIWCSISSGKSNQDGLTLLKNFIEI